MSRLFEGLNQAQLDAVKSTDGASLVIAGAGSGKTRVLTYRIAYLLEKGVNPNEILALTFTNKAAKEMKDRIGALLGGDLHRYLWMGTFHSMFARILRKEADYLGYPSTFSIYDTQDSKSLIKTIVKELKLDDKIYKVGDVYGRISSAKNNLITPLAYYNNEKIREKDRAARRPLLGDIYKTYASRCKKAGAMDFDDLLLNTNILFRDFAEVLTKYQNQFRYILVDEYQDTNYSQYLIVKKLAEQNKNVCVVGDDAQSIYSFRGALIENILNFRKDYPDYQLYKLEQNYRSTQTIVNAANSIIEKNAEQIKKNVFSENEEGEKIQVIKALTDNEEGFLIANSILDMSHAHRLQHNDFAILYRTNAQSRIFEEALRKRNIPYKVYGSISFYQRKEIKDLLAYLRLLANPKDDEALKRVINYPARGIGKTTLGKIEFAANQYDVSLWDVLINLKKHEVGVNKGTENKLESFTSLIKEYMQKADELDAYQVAYNMASASGIMKDLYSGTTPEERSKYENLEELLNGIRDFIDTNQQDGELIRIHQYLENVSLLTDQDNEKDEDFNKVSLMTIHAAKGLEFKHIYIAGVEEELFPSRLSLESPKDMEEERRLFYVAVTRAEKKATISYSQSRYKWGVPTDCEPSRFISELNEEFVNWPDDPRQAEDQRMLTAESWMSANTSSRGGFGSGQVRKPSKLSKPAFPSSARPKLANQNFTPDDPSKIQSGMLVEHQRFGKGKVVQLEGNMPNTKATVFFQSIKQEKQLLLKFAKLRIVQTS